MKCIIDKKSGKVMPWTALQTAGYTLLDADADFNEEGHVYTSGGVTLPSVTGILTAEGFIDGRFYDEFSRTRGDYVHKATHYDDTESLDYESLDPVIKPYLDAWRRFKKESGFVVEQSEEPKQSLLYHYAGTPDVIGHFPTGNLKRAAVELHNDGSYKLIPYADRQDVSLWLSVLACYQWKKNNLRRK